MQDLKPYAFVDALDELRGPSSGMLEMPHSVFWAPGKKQLSLDADDTLEQAYQAVLSEGTQDQIEALINRDNLIRIWPDLDLPIRVAKGWEQRHRELRGNMRASW